MRVCVCVYVCVYVCVCVCVCVCVLALHILVFIFFSSAFLLFLSLSFDSAAFTLLLTHFLSLSSPHSLKLGNPGGLAGRIMLERTRAVMVKGADMRIITTEKDYDLKVESTDQVCCTNKFMKE